MRMWGINPKLLCHKHLYGEHYETHMMAGTIARGYSIKGFVDSGQYDVKRINKRHNRLAKEILRRGGNHNSPLPDMTGWLDWVNAEHLGFINIETNKQELSKRCKKCRRRIRRKNKCNG